jgi:chromatin remodeling complex protein RSC6
MQNFDLSNQENLDDNFLGATLKARKEMKGLTGCKKPIFMIGKKKKAYNECIANYKTEVIKRAKEAKQLNEQLAASSSAAAAAAEKAKKELEETKAELAASKGGSGSSKKGSASSETEEDGKILGMSKGLAIGLGIGVVVLAVGGFVVYKKFIKK